MMTTVKERFDDKWTPEPNSGCWLWTACGDKDGYGFLRVANKNVKAHRLSYELHKGPIPPDLMVLHKCDTPACVNPDHLYLGNNSANQIDAARRGRNASQKLTVDAVVGLRRRWQAGGVTQAALCAEYGLSTGQMSLMLRGRKWAHVDQ